MPKTIKPVDLWVPDYYKRTPESLFKNELAFKKRNHDFARVIARHVFDSVDVYEDPNAIAVLQDGPCVLVSNHLDFSDPVLMGYVMHELLLPRPEFAAMAELFDIRHPHVADFIASLGSFPLDRARMQNGDKSCVRHFLNTADYVLEELGQPLVIFPEGGIHRKPKRYPNMVGEVPKIAAKVAKRAKVPLVVAGLAGTRMATPRSVVPGVMVRAAMSITDVFGPDELPGPIQLRMAMQTNANIAQTLVLDR
jgi:1-acyl-sn-glycerol-3-phosphate acyltransferase